jgi:hypothetical protein
MGGHLIAHPAYWPNVQVNQSTIYFQFSHRNPLELALHFDVLDIICRAWMQLESLRCPIIVAGL